MTVKFFVDENDLALGKALSAECDDVVFPGHADLPEVPRQTPTMSGSQSSALADWL